METITQCEVNIFLNNLRETGKINMWGAAPYISEMFGISKAQARKMLTIWMESFDKDE